MVAEQPLDEVASDIERLAINERVAGFTGLGLDLAHRSVQLYWHGTLDSRVSALIASESWKARVVVRYAPYSRDTLIKEESRLLKDKSNGRSINFVAAFADYSGLDVTVDPGTTHEIGSSVTVRVKEGRPVRKFDCPMQCSGLRWNDTPPYYGGDAINPNTSSSGSPCSTGFEAYNPSNSIAYMLTAAHCGLGIGFNTPVSNVWVGNSGSCCPGQDAMAITKNNQIQTNDYSARIWVGSYNAPSSRDVVAWTANPVGALRCTSGAYSGEVCNNVVTQDLATSGGLTGFWMHQQQGLAGAGSGDSGGPVYSVTVTTNARAAGLIDGGGSTTVPCPGIPSNTNPLGYQRTCSPDVFATDMLANLNALGLQLAVLSPTPFSQAPILADNGSYMFVADRNHLRKYVDGGSGGGYLSGSDASGLTGGTCPNYSSAYRCVGYEDMGATITAMAINSSYLYIGLSTGRVIKTNMCGTGGNVCAFSDNMGSGPYPGYHYWVGEMDLAGSISSLAVNSSYLYSSFGARTVKTTLCGTGGNMCALGNPGGTAGLSGYGYWIGFQDWSWPVVAQAANNSYVFTSLSGGVAGPNKVCKTNLGSTGGDVFWLFPTGQPEDCTSGLDGYYYGYQQMDAPVIGLAADSSYVWWSINNGGGRLVMTDMCTTGVNVCYFTDGFGTGSDTGSNNWKGREDWCQGFIPATVTSSGSTVSTSFSMTTSTWRIVKAVPGSGVDMFRMSDCNGIGSRSGYSLWQGFQDLTF